MLSLVTLLTLSAAALGASASSAAPSPCGNAPDCARYYDWARQGSYAGNCPNSSMIFVQGVASAQTNHTVCTYMTDYKAKKKTTCLYNNYSGHLQRSSAKACPAKAGELARWNVDTGEMACHATCPLAKNMTDYTMLPGIRQTGDFSTLVPTPSVTCNYMANQTGRKYSCTFEPRAGLLELPDFTFHVAKCFYNGAVPAIPPGSN